MRHAAALMLVASLSACNPNKPNKATMTDIAAERAVKAGFNPGGPAPMATDSVDPAKTPRPGALLPPANLKYRYIGRWAAAPESCASGVWTFESKKLKAADRTTCSFPDTSTTLSGYKLIGTCSIEGRDVQDIVDLTFNEAKRTMRVAAKSLGAIDLIYCGG